MNRTDKIKLLLKRLDDIEGVLPSEDVQSLTDSIVGKEMESMSEKVKQNSTIKFLETINSKLNQFKKDFNLAPVLESIESTQSEIEGIKEMIQSESDNTKNLDSQVQLRIEDLKRTLGKLQEDKSKDTSKNDIGNLSKAISDIQKQVSKIDTESAEKHIRVLQDRMNVLSSKLADDIKEIAGDNKGLSKEIDDKLAVIKKEIYNKISNIGGGQANRNITMNSQSILGKYTDFNFLNSSTIGWVATVDNTLKRVNIMASIISGGGGSGGHTIESNGSVFAARTGLNFSSVFSISDNAGADRTDVDLSSSQKAESIEFMLDGLGGVINTGTYGYKVAPYNGTITGWEIYEDSQTPVSSSIVIDVWKDTYGNYPPTVADTVFTTKPTLTTATKNQNLAPTIVAGKEVVTAGNGFRINVDSVTAALKVKLVIFITRT